jgi:hypothetical protein
MMGPPDVYVAATMAIYGPGEARVVFSAVQFQIDEPASNGEFRLFNAGDSADV